MKREKQYFAQIQFIPELLKKKLLQLSKCFEIKNKPRGLDLSQFCLHPESQHGHHQKVRLHSQENLNIFKKCALTLEKS